MARRSVFFDSLDQLGANVTPLVFPDHYSFEAKDFAAFSDQDVIVMTEKDAVKCDQFATKNTWFLLVNARLNHLLTVNMSAILNDRLGIQA
ncbi:MAG: tetraacyldisaccharide 4'-kinase [Gammaproteobacteria bacterium]|nr:tetraacyldisaccharide 4'-kinase [Gammaproteobacteria bacterium]